MTAMEWFCGHAYHPLLQRDCHSADERVKRSQHARAWPAMTSSKCSPWSLPANLLLHLMQHTAKFSGGQPEHVAAL